MHRKLQTVNKTTVDFVIAFFISSNRFDWQFFHLFTYWLIKFDKSLNLDLSIVIFVHIVFTLNFVVVFSCDWKISHGNDSNNDESLIFRWK